MVTKRPQDPAQAMEDLFLGGDTTLGSNHSVDVVSVSCVEVEKSHLPSSFNCGRCITRYYPLHMEVVV